MFLYISRKTLYFYKELLYNTVVNTSYENCRICPRECGVNRREKSGYCGAKDRAIVSLATLHFWEEPCISGDKGSGTVFFSGCNLRCNYCQNAEISRALVGEPKTASELADIFLSLQNMSAHNVNLVTATPYLPTVIEALSKAKEKGLKIPVVYNTGGYEKVEAVRALEGKVNVYLPDFKYVTGDLAKKYSQAEDYPSIVINAIDEMVRQVGAPRLENGIIKSGVIIRHLVLPGHKDEAQKVLRLIAERWGKDVFVSIMRQYTPDFATADCDLTRRVTSYEYNAVANEALRLCINGFTQSAESATKAYTPDFTKKYK